MPSYPEHEFDSRLLDLHLGLLSDEERADVLKRVAADAETASQHEALTAMFDALGAARRVQPELPAGLIEKISANVAAAGPPPRVVRPTHEPAREFEEHANIGVIRLGNLREIAAVAAVIVMAVGLGVPSLLQLRERGRRVGCVNNMAGIGRGMQSYAMANLGSLPFAGWGSNNSWRPTADPQVDIQPNRSHVYRIVLAHQAPARLFVCPSSRDVPMSEEQVAVFDDFPESRNVSYAYQNMAGLRPSLEDNPDLPVLGDDNPLFDNGVPLFRALGFADPANANSRAHGGAGQNVLTLRGAVKWMVTPNAGLNGDNIWTLNGVEEYTGREGPQTASDSHLLK